MIPTYPPYIHYVLWTTSSDRPRHDYLNNMTLKLIEEYNKWELEISNGKVFLATRRNSLIQKRTNNERMDKRNCIIGTAHTKKKQALYIRYKQLSWFGHIQQMAKQVIPKQISKWQLKGRKKTRQIRLVPTKQITISTQN